MQRFILCVIAFFCLSILTPEPAMAARSYDNCTGFIDSLPASISKQGTWCLRKDLNLPSAGSTGIYLSGSNITIDCNDFKLGGLIGGSDTTAWGITAAGSNITVRNCNIRGFEYGIHMDGGTGQVVEDNIVNASTVVGIYVYSDSSVVRRNRVLNTGGSTAEPGVAIGIETGYRVDILDNIIGGVMPAPGFPGDAYGIAAGPGSITGNLIRQVVGDGGTSYGIINQGGVYPYVVRDIIDNNKIFGPGSGIGLACDSLDIARDNMIVGYPSMTLNCADAGGNSTN